jgi:hypothetical protein
MTPAELSALMAETCGEKKVYQNVFSSYFSNMGTHESQSSAEEDEESQSSEEVSQDSESSKEDVSEKIDEADLKRSQIF